MLRLVISVCIILGATLVLLSLRLKPEPWRTLLGPQQMTRDIRLSKVATDGVTVVVSLEGQDTCPFLNQFPKRLSDTKIQVWLLEADGTALFPSDNQSYQGTRNDGCDSNVAKYWFSAKRPEPISLVVSIEDVPTIRPITIDVK